MPVNISYIEDPNSMLATLIVEDPSSPNSKQEFKLPKFILDLVRTSIQNDTLNLSTLWARTTSLQKSLP